MSLNCLSPFQAIAATEKQIKIAQIFTARQIGMEFRILKKIGIENQINDFLDKVSESGLLFKEGHRHF